MNIYIYVGNIYIYMYIYIYMNIYMDMIYQSKSGPIPWADGIRRPLSATKAASNSPRGHSEKLLKYKDRGAGRSKIALPLR